MTVDEFQRMKEDKPLPQVLVQQWKNKVLSSSSPDSKFAFIKFTKHFHFSGENL